MAPDLLSSAEVCERLDIDRSTLSRWVKAGDLQVAMRLPGANGAFLFSPAEIERLEAEEERRTSKRPGPKRQVSA